MEPLAQACKLALEMDWLTSDISLMMQRRRRRRRNTEQPESPAERLNASRSNMEKVCEMLALARIGDEKTSVN